MNTITRSVLIGIVSVAAFAGVSMSGAQAQRAGFDGTWSVLVITDKGECDRAYRYPVRIRGGKVGHTDPSSSFAIGGRVGAGGTVKVFVARGDKRADGTGRLTRAGGGGKWKSSRGECSGHWTAERRG
ncbi:MAG TPA: hypothetical protein VJL90_06105 [Pseudorhodoplanes sp.]|nr:hypothetical protein [Pseudorhodoplanes sp.]